MKDFSERMYFDHPDRMEFIAKVVRVEDAEDGISRVWLDATCFYPESGGQPADGGTLGGFDIVDVVEDDRGVCHHVKGRLEAGAEVKGQIDSVKRFDHMQQHSGQHILSRIFLNEHGVQTVGFHLGEKSSTIDLEGARLGPDRLAKVEAAANREVLKDSCVESRVVTRKEYEEILSKADEKTRIRSRLPEEVETVRVVEMGDVDISSCCGTHCRRTGQVGPIKITGTEKIRGDLRVEFLCGYRALRDYSEKHDLLMGIGSIFTTDWRESLEAVERLTGENKALRKEVANLGKELVAYRTEDVGAPDIEIGPIAVFTRQFDDADSGDVRDMANTLKGEGSRIVIFGIKGPKPSLIFTCSEDVGVDMGGILKAAALVMGAKGGGRGSFAQGGGGDPALLGAAIDAAVDMLRKELA